MKRALNVSGLLDVNNVNVIEKRLKYEVYISKCIMDTKSRSMWRDKPERGDGSQQTNTPIEDKKYPNVCYRFGISGAHADFNKD